MRAPGSGASSPASSTDAEAVRGLIGRAPHAGFRVAVRCPHGTPAVIENAPRDERGHPFPTRAWLTCRALSLAVSRLEADGGVRLLEEDPSMAEPLATAHAVHQERHDGHRVAGTGDPRHVKCLHAHLAFALAEGGSPVGDWIIARGNAEWPAECCRGESA